MAALICALPLRAAAHDIPNDVQVQAFVKPDGRRLQLLMRVPLLAMREVDFPRRGIGILDLARADDALSNAAKLWIADNVELYEGDVRLGYPRVVEVRASLPSDKSFASYEEALAHVTGAPAGQHGTLLEPGTARRTVRVPDTLGQLRVSNPPKARAIGVAHGHRAAVPATRGATRAYEFHGDPGLIRLDPRWHHAALRFVELGFLHILDGTDHLLFLFASCYRSGVCARSSWW